MKKFLLTAAMGVLFFVGLTSMVSMSAKQTQDCQGSCDYLVGAGLFPSHGACISACHTCTEPGNETSYAVCLCKIFDAQGQLKDMGWNFGQCVTIVKR